MIEQLKQIKLFRSFNDEELEELAGYIKTEQFAADDVIFQEGDEGISTYIIESGRVEILKNNRTLTLFKAGDVFGEMALFENAERSADAVSRSDTKVYVISNSDFRFFIDKHPENGSKFLYTGIQEMSKRLRTTSNYLVTVFETGRIVGGSYVLEEMARLILERLIGDLDDVTGGMILLLNPFTDMYDETASLSMETIYLEMAVEHITNAEGNNIRLESEKGTVIAVPLKDIDKILGYIFLEKTGDSRIFSTEQEVILSAVGNQIGMGILNAYSRQEDEARQRLERNRMRGF